MSYNITQGAAYSSTKSPDQARSKRSRSRSPHSRHHHHHTSKRSKPNATTSLPFGSSPLIRHALVDYKPMFGLYLEIQKHITLEDLSEDEVRGRWKSFVGKWNRGELAEGWYDPSTLEKAKASASETSTIPESRLGIRDSPTYDDTTLANRSSDDDIVGPTLPGQATSTRAGGKRPGPALPNLQDIELNRELEEEDSQSKRLDLRYDRKLDRKQQKERLEEIVPRAEAGSKDRMLEKKREKADSNRAFASAKTEAGGVEEVPESDLLGDEDGGIEGYKKQKKEVERKKNERELRKEEILRARTEEREERIKEYKAKEAKTMSGLVALAKARFG